MTRRASELQFMPVTYFDLERFKDPFQPYDLIYFTKPLDLTLT